VSGPSRFFPAVLSIRWSSGACLFLLGCRVWAAAEAATVPITALAFTPDGQELVSNGARRVDVRSAKDCSLQRTVPCALSKITALAFDPGGSVLAAAGGEPGVSGAVLLLDWRTKTVRQHFTNATDLVNSVAFSHDGSVLAAASGDHRARLWRRPGTNGPFAEAFTLTGHAGPVLAVAFSPGDGTVVTASADRSIKVWSTEDGRLLRTFGHHLEAVNALAFRPAAMASDKTPPAFCASASDDRTVRIWQPEIGRMVRILRGHRAAVLTVVYAQDGRSLFSAGKEGIIRRFSADSDERLSEWRAGEDWIYALALSPDGRQLAYGNWAGEVGAFGVR